MDRVITIAHETDTSLSMCLLRTYSMQSQSAEHSQAAVAPQSPAPVHALPIASATTPSTPGTRKRGCNCKKSGCLKLYCECFAANARCSDRCQCVGCKNKEHNRLEIAHAIQAIEKRTQKAFRSPATVARTLELARNPSVWTPVAAAASLGSDTSASPTPLARPSETLAHSHSHTHGMREVCGCQGGICTSECPCLARFGGCDTACPCKGCQVLQVKKPKGCSCKKSNCLKLYCECLATQRVCSSRCHCECCKNRPEHQTERDRAIAAILERNPLAFQPKVARGSSQHLRGCNCRKSGCMKNYCECHQAGVPCTSRCACHQCRNTEMLVSAKKMLVFKAPGDSSSAGRDAMPQTAKRAGASTKRAYRKASFDAPSPAQQQEVYTPGRAPSPSAALELLSRSAPPATRPGRYFRGAVTPSKRDAHGNAAHAPPDRLGSVQPLFTKRKYAKATARPLLMDRLADVDAAADAATALPSVEQTVEHDFKTGDSGEPALAELCRSLLLAARTVDTPTTTAVNRVAPSPRDAVRAADTGGSDSVQSPASDVIMSPRTDELLCAEDIETPDSKSVAAAAAISSSDTRHRVQTQLTSPDMAKQAALEHTVATAAAQERAVLQEVSVWLRTITATATSSHRK